MHIPIKTVAKRLFDFLLLLVFSVMITVVFYLIVDSLDPEKKYYHVTSSWPIDTGTITHRGYGKTGTTTMEYTFNGNKYNLYTAFNVYGFTVGEKYLIRINPQHPDKFIVLDWTPFFEKSEKTTACTGTINKIFRFSLNKSDSFFSNSGVTFSYKAGNETISRSQVLPPNYKQLYPQLEKGQQYQVLYWNDNSERSVIFLHK